MDELDFEMMLSGLRRDLWSLVVLLEDAGESFWAPQLRIDLERIERFDRLGLAHLQSCFGGMGSINDLVIHPSNGHRVPTDRIEAVNLELNHLCGAVADQTRAVLRSLT